MLAKLIKKLWQTRMEVERQGSPYAVCSPTAAAAAAAAASVGPGGKLIKTAAFLSHNLSTMCVFFLLLLLSEPTTIHTQRVSEGIPLCGLSAECPRVEGGFREFFAILLMQTEMFRNLN